MIIVLSDYAVIFAGFGWGLRERFLGHTAEWMHSWRWS